MENNRQNEGQKSGLHTDVDEVLGTMLNQQMPSISFDRVWELHRLTVEKNKSKLPVKKNLRKKVVYAASAAAIGGVCILGAGIASPTIAAELQKIPFIGEIYEQGVLYDSGWEQIDKQKLATPANYTVSDNGITMRITNIFYDGARIALGYELKIDQNSNMKMQESVLMDVHPSIDGVKTDFIAVDNVNKAIGENTYTGTMRLTTSTLPDESKINLKVNKIADKQGKWNVAVPLSTEKTASSTRVFIPMTTANYKDFTIKVREITFTPVTTELVVDVTGPKGKTVDVSFGVKDNIGTALASSSGGGENLRPGPDDQQETLTHRLLYETTGTVNKKPDSLTLLPTNEVLDMTKLKQKDVYASYTGKLPVEMKASNNGKIKITNLEFLPDKTLVHYEASSADNQSPLLFIEDQKGKTYTMSKFPVRTARESYAFVMEFPKIDSQKGIRIRNVVEEYPNSVKKPVEIKIPIRW